jgi:hypothetical protein
MKLSRGAMRPWWYTGSVALAIVLAAIVTGAARAGRPDVREDVGVARSVTIVEPSAFDWGDAGVGAAGAFGLMLLGSGIALIAHSHRRAQTSTSS